MHIRCPHCREPVEIVHDAELHEVTCPSCGSGFNFLQEAETISVRPGQSRKLAQFELLNEVGAGQFGSVFKARDTQLDRIVAVKVPRTGNLDASREQMFFRDARAAAQLRHDNIVSVYEIGRDNNTVFIASEYIDGANLQEWLRIRKLSAREAAALMVRIAQAVHHAHEQGVIHRDLKPANILMDLQGAPHVADFGLAKRETGEITMTEDGRILGTPAYMSPEQASGKGHGADRRSDVYSLGVILFELLTGELPFRGSLQMLVVQILNDDPPSLRALAAKVPRDLEVICLKCLEKLPSRRYQSADELAGDLNRFLAGEPIHARPVGRLEWGIRWCQRNRTAASLIATSVALLCLLGIGGPIIAYRESVAAAKETSLRTAQLNAIRETRALVEGNMEALRDDSQLNRPEFQHLRVRLLNQTLEALTKINESLPDDPAAWQLIADTYYVVGRQHDLGGALQDAVTAYANAADYYGRITDSNPNDLNSMGEFAICLRQLQTTRNRIGDYAGSLDACERMIPLYERLAEANPEVYRKELAYAYDNLGVTLKNSSRGSEGRTYTQRGLVVQRSLAENNPNDVELQRGLAYFYNNLASVDMEEGHFDEAEINHLEAIRIRQAIVDRDLRDNSRYEEFKSDLARSRFRYADLLRIRQRLTDGVTQCQQAFNLIQEIIQANPTNNAYHEQFAECCGVFASLRLAERKLHEVVQLSSDGLRSISYLENASTPSPRRILLSGHLQTLAMEANLRLGNWQEFRSASLAASKAWRTVVEMSVAIDDEDRADIVVSLMTTAVLDDRSTEDLSISHRALSEMTSPLLMIQIASYGAQLLRGQQSEESGMEEPQGPNRRQLVMDIAFDALETASRLNQLDVIALSAAEEFAPLRAEARFQSLLRQFQAVPSMATGAQ